MHIKMSRGLAYILLALAANLVFVATRCNFDKCDNQISCESSNNDNAFRCPNDGRCIPKDWLCDFTYQCLYGEDEFGCVPSSCQFEVDLCNWLNKPALETSNQTSWNFWRIHRGPSYGFKQPDSIHQLSESVGSSFAYAPLRFTKTIETYSARLSSPLIGQTSSTCQLRFRYFVSTNATPIGQGYEMGLWFNVTQVERDSRRTLWAKSFVAASESETEIHPLIGLIELGHIRHSSLEFSAKLTLSSGTNKEERELEKLGRLQVNSYVALDWLEFHECNWPLGSRESEELAEFDMANLDTSDNNMTVSLAFTCPEDKFRCENGICLDKRKLCNWVDDCCQINKCDAVTEADDESYSVCQSVPAMENFERSTLAPNSSMPDTPSDGLLSRKSVSRRENRASWTMGAYWPETMINIQNSLSEQFDVRTDNPMELPATDHSTGTKRGHYLSLELPASSASSTSGSGEVEVDQQLYWLYLDSPWLFRKSRESGECRVKFFYNFVSSEFAKAQQSQTWAAQIYIAIQHFVLELDPNRSSIQSRRTLDHVIHTEGNNKFATLFKAAKSKAHIEYPGVDFWREVNVNIEELNENELFFIRILILFDNTVEDSMLIHSRASINFDDLATHFGCSLAYGLSANLTKLCQDFKLNTTNPLKSLESVASNRTACLGQGCPNQGLKHNGEMTSSVERPDESPCDSPNETHKLITSVLLILLLLIGVITLLVFVVVPYIERFAINQQEQIIRDLRDMDTLTGIYETANGLGWIESSRDWRHSSPSDLFLTTSSANVSSNVATFNSDSYPGRMLDSDTFSGANINDSCIGWPETGSTDNERPFFVSPQTTRRASIV